MNVKKTPNNTRKILLSVNDLAVDYKTKTRVIHAVKKTSFNIKRGECLGLVGESGCGKTTIALSLLKLLPDNASINSGKISLSGKQIHNVSENKFRNEIRWKKISMVFQGAMNSLNPVIRVGDQIIEPLTDNGVDKKSAKKKAKELLEEVGLKSAIYSRYPHELSGGMKQRIVIAMALITDPDLIILDEPTSALDVSVQAQIMNLLKRFKREKQLSFLFITHDIALASDLSDRLAVMSKGKLVEYGDIDSILKNPKEKFTRMLLESFPSLNKPIHKKKISSSTKFIEIKNVNMTFQTRKRFFSTEDLHALSNVSLDIYKGEALALVGESGSGKTTLARVIVNLLNPTSGNILVKKENLNSLIAEDPMSFRKRFQMIFQDPYSSLNTFMNVNTILEEPLIIHDFNDSSSRTEIIHKCLKSVQLTPPEEFLNKYPHMLSGGQRQRIGIARSLVLNPDFLIADEPVSMIDASSRLDVLSVLQQLKEQNKITLLYITHDLATARVFSDRIAVMLNGMIIELGDSNEIIKNPMHPYTKSLIESVPDPNPDNRFRERNVVSNDLFSIKCTYLDTNNIVVDPHIEKLKNHKCRKSYPNMIKINKNHFVYCHRK